MRIGIDARPLCARPSGIARYLVDMSAHLAAQGHEVIFYTPTAPQVDIASVGGARVRAASANNAITRVIWGQTTLPRQAEEDGLDVFWGPAHRLPARLPHALARVVTVHDLVWHYFAKTMRPQSWVADRLLMPQAIASADLVVADSVATRDAVAEVLHARLTKLRVVYPGLTTLPAANAEGLQALPDNFALFVGTLEPRKNLERVLAAYASLSTASREAMPLVVAGANGWGQKTLPELIAEAGLGSAVRIIGFVTDEQLAALYDRARFVVFPSLYEGFGFPVIEANSAGKPVLTSSVSSLPEVAGDAGLLVDPTSVGSIAAGLERLIGDQTLYETLASRAKANAARFDWQQSAMALVNVFGEAIALRRARR